MDPQIRDAAAAAGAEAMRGLGKYPGNQQIFISLLQEAGELATVLRSGDRKRVREEAIQVAAMALRLAVYGDDDASMAFAPLEEIVELDKRIETLTMLLTCPNCGTYYEVVRLGKIQPTCVCAAWRTEVMLRAKKP